MLLHSGVQAWQDEWLWRAVRCGGNAGTAAERYHASYHQHSAHSSHSFVWSPVCETDCYLTWYLCILPPVCVSYLPVLLAKLFLLDRYTLIICPIPMFSCLPNWTDIILFHSVRVLCVICDWCNWILKAQCKPFLLVCTCTHTCNNKCIM